MSILERETTVMYTTAAWLCDPCELDSSPDLPWLDWLNEPEKAIVGHFTIVPRWLRYTKHTCTPTDVEWNKKLLQSCCCYTTHVLEGRGKQEGQVKRPFHDCSTLVKIHKHTPADIEWNKKFLVQTVLYYTCTRGKEEARRPGKEAISRLFHVG